jgi:hypothetical protein
VPDTRDLNQLDEAFINILVRENIRHSDLRDFQAMLPSDAPAREYGGALGDYADALLLKERRGPPRSQVSFDEFVSKMRSSIEVLKAFDRPVALAICSSIRFNLNDFREQEMISPTELESGLRFFRAIANGDAIAASPKALATSHGILTSPVCPVDPITYQLLSICKQATVGAVTLQEMETLRQLTRAQGPVSEHDLVKIHVICAYGYSSLNCPAVAQQHFQILRFEPTFGRWAQSMLGELSTNAR